MILSDRDIRNAVHFGSLKIEPLDEQAIQPASLDVRLGASLFRYANKTHPIDPEVEDKDLIALACPYEIQPHEFVLGVIQEKITLNNHFVARIEGKSSVGRLGLSVHTTAGFVDPGFSGYLTLEIFNQNCRSIILRQGMWIAQIAFQSVLTSAERGYDRSNRYYDQDRCEPVASRIHLNPGTK